MIKAIVLVFIIAAASVAVVPAQKAEDAAFKAVIKQMTEAQSAFDAAALDKIYTSDFIEISPAGEFDSREKVLGFYKPELRPDPSKMTVRVDTSEYSIRNYDKTAIVITKLTFNVTANGAPVPPRSMRATVVLRKDAGAWKIASVQYTGIRPAAAAKPSGQ